MVLDAIVAIILIASVLGQEAKSAGMGGLDGGGDTVFSAYITERASHSADDALLTACATVSLKMETPGPLDCGRADVEDYLSRFYADIRDHADRRGCEERGCEEGASHGK